MVEHALKLIWNRRRANGLVVVEIAATFVVAFVLVALAGRAWSNYQRPLGFVYENIWQVRIDNESLTEQPGGFPDTSREVALMLDGLRTLPGIEAAHAIDLTPFVSGSSINGYGRDEHSLVSTLHNTLTADALAALGVHIVDGRSFGPEDEGQEYRAALVNRVFVERAFGGASPIGKKINNVPLEFAERLPPEVLREVLREVRVVGVIDDFRQHGELADETPYAILRPQPADRGSTDLFVRIAPGTDRAVEERIVATIGAIAPGWRATVTPWEELRENAIRDDLLPLRVGATIGAFMLAMVVLGLIGIVWQDVVRRTQEIGLRRAAGASMRHVRAQIVLEMLVVSSLGIALGIVIAVQIPLLAIVRSIDWASTPPALALSAALILGLAALAALYPAWLASRREPADALRYE